MAASVKQLYKNPFYSVLSAAVAGSVALILTLLALPAWLPRLWIGIVIGVIVFAVVLYYATVSAYQRMAMALLCVLMGARIGFPTVSFFHQSGNGNIFEFVLDASNTASFVLLCVLFAICVIADLFVRWLKSRGNLGDGHIPSKNTSVSDANGSVVIQNSPGAQVMNSPPVEDQQAPTHNHIDRIFDTLQQQTQLAEKQASIIERLITQLHDPQQMRYSFSTDKNASTLAHATPAAPMAQEFRLGDIAPSPDGKSALITLENMDQSLAKVELAEMLDTLDDMRTLAAEIRTQLSLWNESVALVLAQRLESQLESMDYAAHARLPEYLFLAARVHVICAEKQKSGVAKHLDQARTHLAKIEQFALKSSLAADVSALRGSIAYIENGLDAALKLLGEIETPYAIRIRLAMYLNKQDMDSAIALIDGRPLDLKWCDLAVTAYAVKDRTEDAKAVVLWAKRQDDKSKYPQCVVRFADVALARSIAGQESGRNIFAHDLSRIEQDKVRAVLDILYPVLNPIVASGAVGSGLEFAAVKIAWQVYHLLGQRENAAEMARLMATRTPIPTDVARSVVLGYIPPTVDLPQRLRDEHHGNFDAHILAAVVQTRMGQIHEAYSAAKALVSMADTDEKKEELFKLLQQCWQDLDEGSLAECESIARPLVEHNPTLLAMFDASVDLRAGKAQSALEILDTVKAEDDLYWVQLRGNALVQLGHISEAADVLFPAAERTRSPMLLQMTADLAFRSKKLSVAVDCYERIVEAEPDNLVARGNLASIYTFHLHDLEKAADQFAALHAAEPANAVHAVNLALCFAQLYRPQESLALYEEACSVSEPDIRALLGRGELLLSTGHPDKALESLQNYRDLYWDRPDYVLAFMNSAHAAGAEQFAHEALCKLNDLRSAGKVDENTFRMVHKDEMVEMFKDAARATEERKKHLHTEMLKGRMPWVWAAQVNGDAIYWSWRLRTQELDWYGDDPVNRASFSVYSTNGFRIGEDAAGKQALVPFACPAAGTRVVADLSALITLHRLGMLENAADYFEEILVPQAYLQTVLEDGRKMVLHQRSRKETAEKISRLVSSGKVLTIDAAAGDVGDFPVVDEYGDSDCHRYRLVDLIEPVYAAGRIDDLAYDQIKKVCGKPTGINEDHPALCRLQKIQIELSTLETVATFGLLDAVSAFYRIHTAVNMPKELSDRLEAIEFQNETRKWHFDLWNTIRGDGRFRFVCHTVPPEITNERGMDQKDLLALLSEFIAEEQGLPLLVDDRACQLLAMNEVKGLSCATFGTDALALALLDAKLLERDQVAYVYQQLMSWRYRFILPTPEILKL